jgi:hypothetical protein
VNTNFTVNKPTNFYQIIIGDNFIVFNNINYTVTTNESRTIFVGEPSIIRVESKTVTVNQSFTLNISCNPNEPIKGWEFKVKFDASCLFANYVAEGNFFDGYQTFPVMGIIDNTDGTITDIYDLIVGQGHVSSFGIFASINFTAISEGNTSIELYDVGICNESRYLINTINNGYVIVLPSESSAEPDNKQQDEEPVEQPEEAPVRNTPSLPSGLENVIVVSALTFIVLAYVWSRFF